MGRDDHHHLFFLGGSGTTRTSQVVKDNIFIRVTPAKLDGSTTEDYSSTLLCNCYPRTLGASVGVEWGAISEHSTHTSRPVFPRRDLGADDDEILVLLRSSETIRLPSRPVVG